MWIRVFVCFFFSGLSCFFGFSGFFFFKQKTAYDLRISDWSSDVCSSDLVLIRDGKARGVALANGEEIFANALLSDLDLKRTFLALFPWKELPNGFVERVSRFRMRGVTAKVNIALDRAPQFQIGRAHV